MKSSYLKLLFIVSCLLFATYLFTRYINLPFVGPNATDQNIFSLVARNYNNWGLLNVKFAAIVYLYKDIPASPLIYFHHPIFMTVFMSFLYKILGYGFWVGRLSAIIPAFLGLIMLFLIGKEVKKTNFGILVLAIAVLIPATTVFGRMIHYIGAWTMLFIISTGFFSFKYVKSKNKIYFYLALICVIFGTLSDWAMTYFTPFLLPLMIKNGKKKEGIILVLTSTITAICFIFYSYLILGSLENVIDAILNRSAGRLLLLPFWPLLWGAVISIRSIVYLNPIFTILSIIYIYLFIDKLIKKKLKNFDLLIFAFFAVGATHILLFPEGSFGHPFWIYLLMPFIALSSADVIFERLQKSYLFLTIFLVLSIIFVLKIENWKTEQNLSNLFRYNLAKSISPFFKPYDTLAVNPDNAIDEDLLQYQFYQNIKRVELPTNNFGDANYYVYSCLDCNLNIPGIRFLAQRFKYKEFESAPGKVYIFFLKQKTENSISTTENKPPKIIKTGNLEIKQSYLRKTYDYLLNLLQVPQI
jgi:hypothetical protein